VDKVRKKRKTKKGSDQDLDVEGSRKGRWVFWGKKIGLKGERGGGIHVRAGKRGKGNIGKHSSFTFSAWEGVRRARNINQRVPQKKRKHEGLNEGEGNKEIWHRVEKWGRGGGGSDMTAGKIINDVDTRVQLFGG